MRFGFKLGKSKKEDNKDEKEQGKEESSVPMDLVADEKTPEPHGPLQELEVDSTEDLEELGFDESLDIAQPSDEDKPAVKVVELQTEGDKLEGEDTGLETDAVASVEEKKEEKPAGGDDSFSSLFADDEEEENPLAALIESLPEVSASEIISDISEIRDIMREGH